MEEGSVGLWVDPFIEEHVGVAIFIIGNAAEAFVLQVADVPLAYLPIVELYPLVSDLDVGIVVSAFRTSWVDEDPAELIVEVVKVFGLGLVGVLVEVELGGEFEVVVDLAARDGLVIPREALEGKNE